MTGTHIPHPNFTTVERFIDHIDSHLRYSPHTVVVYSYFADLYFIVHEKPRDPEDWRKYYNIACCIELRRIDGIEKLIELARQRIAEGKVRPDWREQLVMAMQSQISGKAAAIAD